MDRKIAIVTGASRRQGIGAATCIALASKGLDIFFTYWSDYDKEIYGLQASGEHDSNDDVSWLAKEVMQYGVRCEKLELDLSDVLSPEQLLNTVEEKLGNPSILINNATYSVDVDFKSLTADVLDKHYAVNVRGTMLLSAEFARRFRHKRGGRIINLTSGQSLGSMAGNIAYASTKGAIDAFTVTLSAELASRGMTVNALNPGPTDSGWMSDEVKRHILSKSPTGRIGMPEDAARLITFLVSDDAEWVTGQIMHSEGGFRRG